MDTLAVFAWPTIERTGRRTPKGPLCRGCKRCFRPAAHGLASFPTRGLRAGVRMRLAPATPGKMAAPTWPTRSRRMLRDAAFVRHEVDTIFRRAVHLEPHDRTETAGAIDLSLPVTRPGRYRPRVQQVTSLKIWTDKWRTRIIFLLWCDCGSLINIERALSVQAARVSQQRVTSTAHVPRAAQRQQCRVTDPIPHINIINKHAYHPLAPLSNVLPHRCPTTVTQDNLRECQDVSMNCLIDPMSNWESSRSVNYRYDNTGAVFKTRADVSARPVQ